MSSLLLSARRYLSKGKQYQAVFAMIAKKTSSFLVLDVKIPSEHRAGLKALKRFKVLL